MEENTMNLKPLGNRVVIQVLETPLTSSGIVLPDSIKECSQMGKVVAVGKGNGKPSFIGTEVKVEHVILFSKHAGAKIKVNGVEYLILDEEDILAIGENI
jgi:chaperonin GroES